MKKSSFLALRIGVGAAIGAVNGLLGAGGGLVCVPALMKLGMERKAAHVNAVAIILPITLVSAVSYWLQGRVNPLDVLIYLPGGLLGAFVGTKFMKKISPLWIKRIFGIFMIWAGWRLISK